MNDEVKSGEYPNGLPFGRRFSLHDRIDKITHAKIEWSGNNETGGGSTPLAAI